jgi:hypothetical protein
LNFVVVKNDAACAMPGKHWALAQRNWTFKCSECAAQYCFATINAGRSPVQNGQQSARCSDASGKRRCRLEKRIGAKEIVSDQEFSTRQSDPDWRSKSLEILAAILLEAYWRPSACHHVIGDAFVTKLENQFKLRS